MEQPRRMSSVRLADGVDSDLRELRPDAGASRLRCSLCSKQSLVRHTNFFRLHVLALVTFSLAAALLIVAAESSTTAGAVGFLDAWFTAVSSITEAGLLTIDSSQLSTASQVIVFICMFLGSPILLSVIPPLLRLWYTRNAPPEAEAPIDDEAAGGALTRRQEQWVQNGHVPLAVQRSALKWLVSLVVGYCVVIQVAGAITWAGFLAASRDGQDIAATRGISVTWVGAFHAVSAFNNAGIAFYGDSLTPFVSNPAVLTIAGVLVAAGNIVS